MATEMRDVHIIDVKESDGVRTVRVGCPFCGQYHTHGWPKAELTSPGHRSSHCGLGAYFIHFPR